MSTKKNLFIILTLLSFITPSLLFGQLSHHIIDHESGNRVSISGKLKFLNPHGHEQYNYIYIKTYDSLKGDYTAIDSTKVNPDGSYHLVFNIEHPTIGLLSLIAWNRVLIWLDGNIVVNDRGYDTAKIKVKNPPYIFIESDSPNNKLLNIINLLDYWNYQHLIQNYQELYNSDQFYLSSGDSTWKEYLLSHNVIDSSYSENQQKLLTIIKTYSDLPAIIIALRRIDGHDELKKDILTALIKKFPYFKDASLFLNSLYKKDNLAIGNPLPSFTYQDSSHQEMSLESFKGKYVLIDLWASWCGPCRKALPEIQKIYNTYHNKGLDIISISIDDNRNDWINALRVEKPTWTQLISNNIGATERTYNADGIPHFFLIDTKGNIIGQYSGFQQELILQDIQKALQ